MSPSRSYASLSTGYSSGFVPSADRLDSTSLRTNFSGLFNVTDREISSFIDMNQHQVSPPPNVVAAAPQPARRGRPTLTIEQKAANKRKREEDKKASQ